MEDENWIELRLGLPCGGSAGKSKVNDASSDPKAEGNNNKPMGGNMNTSDVSFKHFFRTGFEKEDSNGQQRSDLVSRQHENFWTDLGKCSAPLSDDYNTNNLHDNVSQFTGYQDLWVSSNKATDTEEEKSGLNKLKLQFEDIDLKRKLGISSGYADTHGNNPSGAKKRSLVSLTTDDGSSGENEGVTESQAEDSAVVSQREDNAKRSDISSFLDKHILPDSSRISSHGQKQTCVSGNDSNLEIGKSAHGIMLPLQPVPVMTMPYPVPVKAPTAFSASIPSSFPSPHIMQPAPLANSERPMVQTMNSSNLHLAFGYSSVHLPTLETDSFKVFGSQPEHVSCFASRVHARVPNSEHSEDDATISHGVARAPHTSSLTLAHETESANLARVRGKHVDEPSTGPSQNEDDKKPKETTDQPAGESSGGFGIRPGIASDVKFGGCGSYPDLPWVSATGPGPNGKTISGVTYKYSINQIKIICACHGSHMSPEEFIQHASADVPSENSIAIVS